MLIVNYRLLITFFIFTGLTLSGVHAQVVDKTDSLQQVLEGNPGDTSYINTSILLAKNYFTLKEYSSADKTLEKAMGYSTEHNVELPYQYYFIRAQISMQKREIKEGIELMQMGFDKLDESPDIEELARANNFMGHLYLYDGQFGKAIDIYEKNIDFIQKNGLIKLLPETYSELSMVYRTTGDIEEHRRYLKLMAESSIKNDQQKFAANAYLRLGDIGMEIDSNFTYAITEYYNSLKILEQLHDSTTISFVILRIGWNHYLNNDLDSALANFFLSLKYSIPINRLTSITNAYGNIGTIYRDLKQYDKAIKYYQESIDYSLVAQDWYNLSWLYKDMSMMYESLDNFKQAYYNLLKHKQFSDSLDKQRYDRGLSEARTRYEAEKAERELEFVTLKLRQHTYLTYGFAGLIFLAVVIGFLILRQFRISSKRRISEMNHKISEITQRNLRQQMNPHFIFNTLNSIQYYMYQHDKLSTNNYLTKFSSLMRKTLENSQHTSIPVKDELDALELYLELESLRFKEKFDYNINVDDDIDLLLMKIPTMLIQPYVENAISHGIIHRENKGRVSIDLKLDKDMIICTIEDNGIGREAAMKIKQEKNGNHNSLGTRITESRLNLVNTLYGQSMKIDYADLKDENDNPSGTRVVIHIPIIT